jgi:2,4-dienoyl-CoA reductase (NADPH2)
LGIWDDRHAEPLARIARFIESQGAVPAIQLAHAGRKASTKSPWEGGAPLSSDEGGWSVLGPSSIPFFEGHPVPREATPGDIETVIKQFAAAAQRAVSAGFQVIEVHAAHGYLLHEFLSPLSNQRSDSYGGSLANRTRLVREVCQQVREIIGQKRPLWVRISATDWADGGWDLEQSVELAKELNGQGVDLIDCSSGALVPTAKIPIGKGYQVPFAARIKRDAKIPTGAVGLITDPEQANDIVVRCDADIVLIGRELLREPYWGHQAYAALNAEPRWPLPYGYAVRRRVSASR